MSAFRSLFAQRKHRRETATREARGENLWVEDLSQEVRIKFNHVIRILSDDRLLYDLEKIVELVCYQSGLSQLTETRGGFGYSPTNDVMSAITYQLYDSDRGIYYSAFSDDVVLSLIEGIWTLLSSRPMGRWNNPRQFYTGEIRTILEDHRVSYDFVEGHIIPRKELIMHSEVVVPTLTLLAGRKDFDFAERRYVEALKSIQDHRFDDAVTDASGSLEAVFDALGCDGKTLDRKAKQAQDVGLMSRHDQRVIDWISADRVAKGDSHISARETTRDDAWLAVHVAGAFMLRLANSENRT